MAEHDPSPTSQNGIPAASEPTRRFLSFGELAIQAKFITREQLQECLDIQEKMRQMGLKPKCIGDILFDKGYLNPDQSSIVLEMQSQHGANAEIGGCRILKKLGEGAMGVVYKGVQMSLDRVVAIKVISSKYSSNAKFRERFLREARAVATLNHENVITGYDVGEMSGIAYFIMEFIDGPTLQKVVNKMGRVQELVAFNIILQVARALEHAHRHNLVHRDVKPDNVMINKDGIAKLCDLGLAKAEVSGVSNDKGRGLIVGTPLFMSPEQARGDTDIDIRSDLYSLGATFYYMVTGAYPLRGATGQQVIEKQIHEMPVPPREAYPPLTRECDRIIMKLLAKKRDERHRTPAELVEEIESVLHTREAGPQQLQRYNQGASKPASRPLPKPAMGGDAVGTRRLPDGRLVKRIRIKKKQEGE